MCSQCPKCYSFNVVPDYGYKFNTGKLPITMPYCCLDCGRSWGGGVAEELRVADDVNPLGCAVTLVIGVVTFVVVMFLLMSGR